MFNVCLLALSSNTGLYTSEVIIMLDKEIVWILDLVAKELERALITLNKKQRYRFFGMESVPYP